MSIFAKLNKKDRAAVFSGDEFPADRMPAGQIQPDGSVISNTKEGLRTFRMVSCQDGKSIYGAKAVWRCVA